MVGVSLGQVGGGRLTLAGRRFANHENVVRQKAQGRVHGDVLSTAVCFMDYELLVIDQAFEIFCFVTQGVGAEAVGERD